MQRPLRSFACRLMPALLLVVLASRAGAQLVPLDGVWFRISVKADGYSVDAESSALKKAHLHTQAFLHLSFAEGTRDGLDPGATYDFQLWTRQDGGIWALSDSGQHQFLGTASGDQLAVDLPLTFTLADGRFIDGRGVFRFDVKLNKQGLLKKARLSTLGGETLGGSTDGADVLAGKLTLKGHEVAEGKLPFEP
jgi:hypothetical protein